MVDMSGRFRNSDLSGRFFPATHYKFVEECAGAPAGAQDQGKVEKSQKAARELFLNFAWNLLFNKIQGSHAGENGQSGFYQGKHPPDLIASTVCSSGNIHSY
jgi:hypothetical protein